MEAALTDIPFVIIKPAAVIGLQLDVYAQHETIPKTEEPAVMGILDAAADPKAVELDHPGPEAGNDGQLGLELTEYRVLGDREFVPWEKLVAIHKTEPAMGHPLARVEQDIPVAGLLAVRLDLGPRDAARIGGKGCVHKAHQRREVGGGAEGVFELAGQ